jgi:FkbM family methyltransferase
MSESALFPTGMPDLSKLYDNTIAGFADSPIIFGSGQLGRRVAGLLKTHDITPIAFTDNNEKLWGSEIDGIRVFSPAEAVRLYGHSHPFIVAIGTVGFQGFANALQAKGVRMILPYHQLAWKFPDTFLPYYFLDTPENWIHHRHCVEAAYQLLHDDLSRSEFARQSLWRCTGDDNLIKDHTTGLHYFREDLFQLPENPIFVDCGAYDGDSIMEWIHFTKSEFSKVYAFEPDPDNLQRLNQTVSGLSTYLQERIRILPNATGSSAGVERFEVGRGVGSSISQAGEYDVQVVTLDETFADKPISMLKMDIEGAEFETLVGARQIIQRDRPILTICIYHHQKDLWRIPLYVASITTDYRFHIRRHTDTWFETVLYAIPNELAVD